MKVSVSVSSSDWRGRHSLCSYRQLFTPPGLLGSPASLLAHSSNSWLPSSPVQQMWWYDPELVSWPWGGLAVGHCTEPHTHSQIGICYLCIYFSPWAHSTHTSTFISYFYDWLFCWLDSKSMILICYCTALARLSEETGAGNKSMRGWEAIFVTPVKFAVMLKTIPSLICPRKEISVPTMRNV